MMSAGGGGLGRGRGGRRQPPRASQAPELISRLDAGDACTEPRKQQRVGRGRGRRPEMAIYVPKARRQHQEPDTQGANGGSDISQDSDRLVQPSHTMTQHADSQEMFPSVPAVTRDRRDSPAAQDRESAGCQTFQSGQSAAVSALLSPKSRERKSAIRKGRPQLELYVPRGRRATAHSSEQLSDDLDGGKTGDSERDERETSAGVSGRDVVVERLHQEEASPSCQRKSPPLAANPSTSVSADSSGSCTSNFSKRTLEPRQKSKTKKTEANGEACSGKRQKRKKRDRNSPSSSVSSSSHPQEAGSLPLVRPESSCVTPPCKPVSRAVPLPEAGEHSIEGATNAGCQSRPVTASVPERGSPTDRELSCGTVSLPQCQPAVAGTPGSGNSSSVRVDCLHFEEVDDYLVDNDADLDTFGLSTSMVASQEDHVSSVSQEKVGSPFGGIFVSSQDNSHLADVLDQLAAMSSGATDSSSSQECASDSSVSKSCDSSLDKPCDSCVDKPCDSNLDKSCDSSVDKPCDSNLNKPCDLQESMAIHSEEDKLALTDVLASSVEEKDCCTYTDAEVPASTAAEPAECTDSRDSSETEGNPTSRQVNAAAATVDEDGNGSESTDTAGKDDHSASVQDEDSWDALFDDNGDCLDESLVQEITNHVGKVKIDKPKKTTSYINYQDYQPRSHSPDLEIQNCTHLIEIYDFPAQFKDCDLIAIFKDYRNKGFDLKWVDDTHAIGVFASTLAANDALRISHPLMKVRSIAEASRQTRSKVKRQQEFLQPYKARPQTTAFVARGLVQRALGLPSSKMATEKRNEERKQLTEAREKKRRQIKQQSDVWEGLGKCAMDGEDA